MSVFFRVVPGGVSVAVKVQPGARRSALLGVAPDVDGTRLRIAVREKPKDGEANRAACAVVAEALQVSAGAVSVLHGATSRLKTLRIDGDSCALVPRLAAL